MIVYHRHFRACGYCNRGLRSWLAARGMSWSAFLQDGIDEQALIDSGETMSLPAIELAKKEAAGAQDGPDAKAGGCI